MEKLFNIRKRNVLSKFVNVRVTEEEHQKVKEMADKLNLTLSDMMRILISKEFEKNRG